MIGFYEMQIVVNGRAREFAGMASGATLAEVIGAMELKGDRVAVEHNGTIVPRTGWPATRVSDGDKLEVVHFVGGGSATPPGRHTRRLALLLLLLASPAVAIAKDYPTTNLGPTGKPTFVVPEFKPGSDMKIVAYGDTRFTDIQNTSDAAPRPRRFLVDRIAEEAPDAIFFSGDLPFHGSDPLDWNIFREETAPWRAAHLRFYPTVGNHEFVPDPKLGLKLYFENLPFLNKNRWYSVQMGSVYLIAIDSIWPPVPGTVQRAWLEDQLAHIPPTVDFVFFLLHMPLVTDIQTEMVVNLPNPAQIELRNYIEAQSEKSRAKFVVVTGHIHNYERFERGRVSYIVSGGGGAAPYPVLIRGKEDLYRQPGFPNFHYLVILIHRKQATVTMKRIADPEANDFKLEVRDTFTLSAR